MLPYFFSFLAGALITLSPCVLPVLPFVTASSLQQSKWGPLFLALGLALSFVLVSVTVRGTGLLFGWDPFLLRRMAGVLLGLSGVLFLWPRANAFLMAPFSRWTGKLASAQKLNLSVGLASEVGQGLLLGLVWSPCSGPSLGTAMSLAGKAGSSAEAAALLSVFAAGATGPFLLLAYGARGLVARVRGQVYWLERIQKSFGFVIVVFGVLIAMEWDQPIETFLINASPDSWVLFLTHF